MTTNCLFIIASTILITIGTICLLSNRIEVGGLLLAVWVISSGFYRRETEGMNKFEECPYCGAKGYYVKTTATTSYHHCYRFDGEKVDNSHRDNFIKYKHGKWAYCIVCDKKLFEFEGEESE